MQRLLLLGISVFVSIALWSQNKNTTLLGTKTYNSGTYGLLNDVWGFTDSLGNEYALVGLQKGVSILDVTDPSNLIEVFYAAGANSIWRDIKVWKKHAFITNESSGGLMIIDLTALPGAITQNDVSNYTGNSFRFTRAHNIYIDENGVAYIFGSNYGNGGAILLDVDSSQTNPKELGVYNGSYFHDGMARGDTLWGSAIYKGVFEVIDVSVKSTPVLKQSHPTTNQFTHNCWISDDGNTLFTTDERSGAEIGAYDVSDFSNIQRIGANQSNPGSGVIPHNTHVYGDFLVTSYYRDGVTIVDATYPDMMVQIGDYDSSPLYQGNGFNGNWGAYPWLPSGNLLISDRENGLMVLGVDYKKGVYIEGRTLRFKDSLKIISTKIICLTEMDTLYSNLNGYYKKAYPDSAFYRFAFSKNGYLPDTIDLVMTNGVLYGGDVYLRSEVPFKLSGMIQSGTNNSGIDGAEIYLNSKYLTYRAFTDSNGRFEIDSFFEGEYEIVAGKWTFKNNCLTRNVLQGDSIYMSLEEGLMDDGTLDFGWTAIKGGTDGYWERQKMDKELFSFSLDYPSADLDEDCADFAFVTGSSVNRNLHDVDGGWNVLRSPVIDLSSFTKPLSHFSYWFKNDAASGFEDSLLVFLTDGIDSSEILSINNQINPWASKWIDTSIYLGDLGIDLSSCHLVFKAGDFGQDDLLEVALDGLWFSEGFVGYYESTNNNQLHIYPNPVSDNLTFVLPGGANTGTFEVHDITGRLVMTEIIEGQKNKINIQRLTQGTYFLKVLDVDGNSYSAIFVKTGS
ncbi:MAG: choice-of-anchor B family protein [Vicingaceae bacterium]